MVVVLRRPAAAPEMPDEQLKALPAHVAHRAELRRRDVVVVNGPFDEQTSVTRSTIDRFRTWRVLAPNCR